VVGDYVTGSYLKGDDGKLTAKSIRFGVKPPPAKGGDAAAAPAAPSTKQE